MNKLTLGIFAIPVVVAMLSVALVVVPIQEADARSSLKVIQKQSNRCSEDATCTNTGTITIGPGHGGPDH